MILYKSASIIALLAIFTPMVGCRERDNRAPDGPIAAVGSPTRRVVADVSGTARATYRVTNRGTRDLVFGPITTTCGCTGATVEPGVVPPGRSATISVEGHALPVGETSVRATVRTNESGSNGLSLEFIMVGSAPIPRLISSPGPVSFGILRPGLVGPSEALDVSVMERRGEPPRIGRAACSLDLARVEGGFVEESPAPAPDVVIRRYHYDLTLAQSPGIGPFAAEIALSGPDPGDRPFAIIPVHGIVRAPIQVAPSALIFQEDVDGKTPAITVTLTSEGTAPLFAECAGHDRSLSVRPTARSGSRAGFVVEVGELPTAGTMGPLVFRTDHPDCRRIEVPVQYWPRRSH